MSSDELAALLREERTNEAAEMVMDYLVPEVTSLTEDRIAHDLAPDSLEILSGTFDPISSRIMIDVDAAYSFLGNSRGALLLYVGQPEDSGSTLYDSGGAALPGVEWHPVGSVNGDSAWAGTTHRRIVTDVDPSKPVTWQLLGAIIGPSATVDVPDPEAITTTPDGTMAFVTSPSNGVVTPIELGRPGFSTDSELSVSDSAAKPIVTGAEPVCVTANDTHVIVSHAAAADHDISILKVAEYEVLSHVEVPGGQPTQPAITPDGANAIVGTDGGTVGRITLETSDVTTAELGGTLQAVGIVQDGEAAYVADAEEDVIHRIDLPDIRPDTVISGVEAPHVVRVGPDGLVWVLSRPPEPAAGRLQCIDPSDDTVIADHELPYPAPSDMEIVPTAGQTSDLVRTAWVVYDEGRYSQFLVGGEFEGEVHSFHHGSFDEEKDAARGVALNDFGEIWVTQPDLDRVWKWPGGRFQCRADDDRPNSGVFFGEYCDVSVYGAHSQPANHE